eukprot:3783772-Prymnesium_polylepis.1
MPPVRSSAAGPCLKWSAALPPCRLARCLGTLVTAPDTWLCSPSSVRKSSAVPLLKWSAASSPACVKALRGWCAPRRPLVSIIVPSLKCDAE